MMFRSPYSVEYQAVVSWHYAGALVLVEWEVFNWHCSVPLEV